MPTTGSPREAPGSAATLRTLLVPAGPLPDRPWIADIGWTVVATFLLPDSVGGPR